MKWIFVACLASGLLGGPQDAGATPHTYTVALAVTDLVDDPWLPESLQQGRAQALAAIDLGMEALLRDLGRCRVIRWSALPGRRGYAYAGEGAPDFIVHAVLHRVQKTFRVAPMEVDAANAAAEIGDDGVSYLHRGPYEMVATPILAERLEVLLVRADDHKVLWSAMRDSSSAVPCDERIVLYNTTKYPGWTDPAVLGTYLADIVRLQQSNLGLAARLREADRWLVSQAAEDIRTARELAVGMSAAFFGELDAHLPVEGSITRLLPAQDGQVRVELDLGRDHGLTPRLRLEVWRPGPAVEKAGQIEIVRVDSVTSVARLRKIEKSLRRRGEGLQPGDRVVSRRRAGRTRHAP